MYSSITSWFQLNNHSMMGFCERFIHPDIDGTLEIVNKMHCIRNKKEK